MSKLDHLTDEQLDAAEMRQLDIVRSMHTMAATLTLPTQQMRLNLWADELKAIAEMRR